ncbi:MAG: HAD hydrolase-like protein, partial [Victivallales bacterium]|nr:HAD hydrolase-like protein [Victivallales bacterium]
YIFFDLDGTLTDPAEGITNSVMYALRHFGIEVTDRKELYPFIGPPLSDSYAKYYGFTAEQSEKGVNLFREYFREKGIFENMPYPGMPELLEKLHQLGCKLVVTSSKPQLFVERILDHFDMAKYFHAVCGATMDEKTSRKPIIIRNALDICPEAGANNTIVVGDHALDVIGAHENGLPACAVLYGYGADEEIATAKPEYTAHTVADVRSCLKDWLKKM